MRFNNNRAIEELIREAMATFADGKPPVMDVNIDYSKRSRFTKGIVKTFLSLFPLGEKVRFINRTVKRTITSNQ